MANTEKFSKNTTFLRIAWKEVNNLSGGQDKTSPAKKVKQQKLQQRQKTRLRIDVNNSQGRQSEATPIGQKNLSN